MASAAVIAIRVVEDVVDSITFVDSAPVNVGGEVILTSSNAVLVLLGTEEVFVLDTGS